MPASRRSRNIAIVAASIAAHVAVLTVVALHAPRLRIPQPEPGMPEAIIPILIMPRAPPPAAAPGSKPAPIRLHRRPQRFALEPLPLKPLVAPEVEAAPQPAPSPGPKVLNVPSAEDALAANARKALRGRLGCDSPSLSRAEREACEDRFASGARDAEFPGLGLEAGKAGDLAKAGARKEADFKYRRSQFGPGVSGSGYSGANPTPGAPNMGMGASGHDLGAALGNDRPEAKVPF